MFFFFEILVVNICIYKYLLDIIQNIINYVDINLITYIY